MKITILTLFPQMIEDALQYSIIKRAMTENIIEVEIVNIRDFSINKHQQVDDYPFGGGAGMLIRIEPLVKALNSIKNKQSYTVLTSACGEVFSQKIAVDLAKKSELVIICGHYEGVDARIDNYIDQQISIGDYIMTGGELASLVIIDSVTRLLDKAISENSLKEESFNSFLLEAPQYTRPEEFDGYKVPQVLLSGHHKNIELWRKEQAVSITKKQRPDLYKKYCLKK